MSCPVVNFPTIISRDCIDLNTGGTDGGTVTGGCCEDFIRNTIAELRAISNISGVEHAQANGVDVAGDSAPIFYVWDPTSLLDDTGLSVIKFDVTDNASPGRLIQCGSV